MTEKPSPMEERRREMEEFAMDATRGWR